MIAKYLVLAGYFAVLLLIGALASRRVRDMADFYVGGKRLGYWVVAFSARASGESAWLLLGLTGMGAFVGISAMWIVLGEVLGVAFAWFCMARPFKHATDRYYSITVPDYIVSRFAGRSRSPGMMFMLRFFPACALALYVTVYVSAQLHATGEAFQHFLELDYYFGTLLGFGIVAVYTLSGGFIAVAWSDLFQGLMMLLGLVALPLVAYLNVPGDVTLWQQWSAVQEGFTSMWGRGGASWTGVLVIVAYLAVGLGFLGSPQVFARFMSIRGDDDLRAGRWVAVAYTVLTDGGAVLIGMLGRYLLVPGDASPEAVFGPGSLLGPAGEGVLPALVDWIFQPYPFIVGLYIAAVLAAIMSTIDSLLVVASSTVARDVYQQTWRPHISAGQLVRISRWATILMASAALGISLTASYFFPALGIFRYVLIGWSGIAATFCPMMILSLFWPRYNAYGAFASMLTGSVSVLVFKFVVPRIPGWGAFLAHAEEMAPSFLLALAAGILVTLLTGKQTPADQPTA